MYKGNLLFSLFCKGYVRTNTLSFFGVIPKPLCTFVTSGHELLVTICEECYWLYMKPRKHHILGLFIVCKLVSTNTSLSSLKIW